MALAVTASAFAAAHCRPCHPDPFGTRLLSVPGTVRAYVATGATVRVQYTDPAACGSTYTWKTSRAPLRTVVPRACSHGESQPVVAAAAPVALTNASGGRIVRVVDPTAGTDEPARLEVRDRATNRLLHSWPLPARPVTLDLDGDLAVFSAEGRGGLFALRLSDGRVGFVGVNRDGDMPQIEAPGVVYQDDLYRHSPNHPRTAVLMKFVPRAAVYNAIQVAGRPIITPGKIRAIAMDGPRVALAVADSRGLCDQIRFWNIPWNFQSRLTQRSGPTCPGRHAPGGIRDVRVAGVRAEWVTTYGGVSTVLAASIIRCQEWVLARPTPGAGGDRIAGLAGDGNVLSYAITGHERELRGLSLVSVLRRGSESRTRVILDGQMSPRAIAADADRVAVLQADDTVEVRTIYGAFQARFDVGKARAIAFRNNRVVTLGRNVVSEFDAATGEWLRGWHVPAGVRSRIDVHFGIAVLTRGSTVYALDLDTGRIAALANAPAPVVNAEIEAPGIAYAFNSSGTGHARFIRFADIEAALGY